MPIYVGSSATVLKGTGATQLGNSADDDHFMTGSLYASGSFVLSAPASGSHPHLDSMQNNQFTFFYDSATLKVSMKVDGAELTGSVASVAAPSGGSSLSAAGLYGDGSYSRGGASGYSMGMNACSAAGSSAGTSQGWYRYLINGGNYYRFYITTSGVVYTSNGGSTTNLDSTAGSVRC